MMKKKNYLFAMLAAATLFTACSSDDLEKGGQGQEGLGESAYLSLNLVPNKSDGVATKANTSEPGSNEERGVTQATAYIFDSNKLLVKKITYGAANLTEDASGNVQGKAVKVPASSNFVFVVTGSEQPAATERVTTFDALNAVMTKTAAELTANNNFMMTNAGTETLTEGQEQSADACLVDITSFLNETKTGAEANPAIVKVNRVVAKVEVSVKDPLTVLPTGTNVAAELKGWELDRTSNEFYPYASLIGYANASATVAKGYYRMSPSFETLFNDEIEVKTKFDLATGTFANTFPSSAYCLENTMKGLYIGNTTNYQKENRTTAVLVKAYYRPGDEVFFEKSSADYTDGDSYFLYGGNVYTLEQVQNTANTAANAEFVKLVDGLKALDATKYASLSATTSDITVWNDKDKVDAKDAVKVTTANIKFFQQGLNYYRILIRHDDAVTTSNALGRYGVVRNNWYKITINSISGPADPWAPTPDPSTDDDTDKYLSVSIVVNQWTQWTQNVDL